MGSDRSLSGAALCADRQWHFSDDCGGCQRAARHLDLRIGEAKASALKQNQAQLDHYIIHGYTKLIVHPGIIVLLMLVGAAISRPCLHISFGQPNRITFRAPSYNAITPVIIVTHEPPIPFRVIL